MKKTAALIVFLFVSLFVYPYLTAAQSDTESSVCEHREKWENPETFQGPSITKDKIKQCLRANMNIPEENWMPIKNHHIVFEDYRDAWQELAKETGDYAIPLLIEGGILYAHAGKINLRDFRDPTITKASSLTKEQRALFGIDSHIPITFIHAEITWHGVLIDSAITGRESVFNKVSFFKTTFKNRVLFFDTTFKDAMFSGTIFHERSSFSAAKFREKSSFHGIIFNDIISFIASNFNQISSFNKSEFRRRASFNNSKFNNKVHFRNVLFKNEISFKGSTCTEIDFTEAQFDGDVDLRDVTVTGTVKFDQTTWAGRGDLRQSNVQELRWDNPDDPSDVKGSFDFREAQLGSATFQEIRFQDPVDFSRATFGRYHVKDEARSHSSAHVVFANNTFENEVAFLHATFYGPALLRNNRFRSSLNFTGATFRTPHARLCASYNQLHRFLIDTDHVGNPLGFSPSRQLASLFVAPLEASRIRQIRVTRRRDPSQSQEPIELNCVLVDSRDKVPLENTSQDEEPLADIYKTLATSFKEANDQAGVNQAWYLQTIAEREQDSAIWAWLSWFFLDIPSRYSVDVWRVVWLSVAIMLWFYILYLIEHLVVGGVGRLWRWIRRKPRREPREVHILGHPDRHRAFQLRIFEPIHRRIEGEAQRQYVPWRDAATLSVRSFLKIGLGTVYPHTRLLKCLTTVEWLIGAYMLIHFILAVKNNLPFILPFLGVVN
jgi:uncharacterized protein YjbI with pentapeptide repeats